MSKNLVTMRAPIGPTVKPPPLPQPTTPAQSITAYKYNILAGQYTQSKNITVDPKCNGWTAINKGTLTARVNGIPLEPPPAPGLSGESYGVAGNLGEIYSGLIQIDIPAADPAPLVILIQKNYL